ncbi:hypothetical protein [Enterocloster clostridioformis]|uniref:hypothetical protein n=1 Tax=Enterocloster clostridioformis TaxID=1531 RepID=UPI00135C4F0A|nr:hypothetical protein [Enterocloster clostridioformis]MCA5577312.1 hypothetical protein [Enterocloster clostridioformis]
MKNRNAGRSWQKQSTGYPDRGACIQKANAEYWKKCSTTIRTVNFSRRAKRGA